MKNKKIGGKMKNTFYVVRVLMLSCFLLILACGENPNIKKGKQFIEIEDFKQAEESFKKAISEEPQNADAHYLLGVLKYDNFGDRESALKEYDMAIKSGLSKSSNRFSERAEYFASKEYWRPAVDHILYAIKTSPENPEFHYRLGYFYYKMDDYDKSNMANAFINSLNYSKSDKYYLEIESIPIIKERLGIRPLTKKGHSMDPIFSFDEEKIYFVMDPTGSKGGYSPPHLSIYCMDIKDNRAELILQHSWGRPSISNNDKKMVIGSILIDLDTNDKTELTHNFPSSSRLSFSIVKSCISPDGKSFVFSSYYYNQGIYLVDINSSKETIIIKEKAFSPSYLSDGNKISFIGEGNFEERRGWGKTIEIVNINGKDRKIIYTASEDQEIYEQFYTKNDKIIFISYIPDYDLRKSTSRGSRLSRFKINIDGSNLEKLNDIAISDIAISDIAKDNKLAVATLDGKVCLYPMYSKDYNRVDLIQALTTFIEIE